MEQMPLASLPRFLQPIAAQVARYDRLQPNLDALANQEHIEDALQRVPGLHVEDGGEVSYLDGLSPGCQTCKDGTWDCVFITMRCNLDCPFCYSPHAIPVSYRGSVFGDTPARLIETYRQTNIHGISFSGGEPFLEPELLLEWLVALKQAFPTAYTWVYTNGLLVDPSILRQLGHIGLDEMRFNAAATGYTHPTVMNALTAAARFIPNLTVEIPALPGEAQRLLDSLSEWEERGVRYLNLHELLYEPGTNAASLFGPRQLVITPDHHTTYIHPHSRDLTFAVMERVQRDHLRLFVNDCSTLSKLRQVHGRRISLSPLTRKPHEKLLPDGTFETFYACQDTQDSFLFHPDTFNQVRASHPRHRYFRLLRLAPLSLADQDQWIQLEEIAL
jgi:pyruvate formate-lyase activating enzyme-like uncharacterized protein